MREPKRYAFKVNEENDFDLIEHSNGEYVRYEDYARLKAEVERLTQLNSTLALRYDATNSMLDGCAKEIEEMETEVEELEAQVERLTKAVMHSPAAQLKLKELEGKTTFDEINPDSNGF
jgi:chromosome segregation ATPase